MYLTKKTVSKIYPYIYIEEILFHSNHMILYIRFFINNNNPLTFLSNVEAKCHFKGLLLLIKK
jgi:hypothetical protein